MGFRLILPSGPFMLLTAIEAFASCVNENSRILPYGTEERDDGSQINQIQV